MRPIPRSTPARASPPSASGSAPPSSTRRALAGLRRRLHAAYCLLAAGRWLSLTARCAARWLRHTCSPVQDPDTRECFQYGELVVDLDAPNVGISARDAAQLFGPSGRTLMTRKLIHRSGVLC